MLVSQNGIEDIKVFGTPIKELIKEKDSAFQELGSAKGILSPLKELDSQEGFSKLSDIKDTFTPIKELIAKDEKSSKDDDRKSEEKGGLIDRMPLGKGKGKGKEEDKEEENEDEE